MAFRCAVLRVHIMISIGNHYCWSIAFREFDWFPANCCVLIVAFNLIDCLTTPKSLNWNHHKEQYIFLFDVCSSSWALEYISPWHLAHYLYDHFRCYALSFCWLSQIIKAFLLESCFKEKFFDFYFHHKFHFLIITMVVERKLRLVNFIIYWRNQ